MFRCYLHHWSSHDLSCPVCFPSKTNTITTDSTELNLEKGNFEAVTSDYLKSIRIMGLEKALKALAERHRWHGEMGECICKEHEIADELLGDKCG